MRFVFLIMLFWSVGTEARVKYQFNRIHGLYNFVETISGRPHRSATLKKAFEKSPFNTQRNQRFIKEFQKVSQQLWKGYNYTDYPKSRRMGQSLDKLFIVRSAFSKSLGDFSLRTMGLLPINEHKRLFMVLRQFESVYYQLIWNRYKGMLSGYRTALEQKSKAWRMDWLFKKAAYFYQASWPKQTPFFVSLYPIPGKSGHTSAESIGLVESVGVLVEKKDFVGTFGVIFHEMCHSLYESQSVRTQKAIEKYYLNSRSPYAQHTYKTINEALATAIGNGWVESRILKKTPPGSWYSEKHVNGLAQALFPYVKSYLAKNRVFDQALVNKSIELYAARFPNSIYEYENLLLRTLLVTDAKTFRPNQVAPILSREFRINSLSSAAPINHRVTMAEINDNLETTVIVVGSNHVAQLYETLKALGYLRAHQEALVKTSSSYVFSLIDQKGRAVVIIKAKDQNEIQKALRYLKTQKRIDPSRPLVRI